jgi:hypothetical protein
MLKINPCFCVAMAGASTYYFQQSNDYVLTAEAILCRMECKDKHKRVLRSGYVTVEIVIPVMGEESHKLQAVSHTFCVSLMFHSQVK